MVGFLLGALKVIIVLGTLIFIHEFGHFIVAKLCKMRVLKFSIGFGPKLINKKKGETEYSLRLIPLGGFVQLEGEDEESDAEGSFSKRPIWQRLLVLLAGVFMNISLALFIYLCIYMNLNYYSTNKISANSDANVLAQYGLNVGDTIYKINGTKIYTSDDIEMIVYKSKSDNFEFEIIDPNDKHRTQNIIIKEKEIGYLGAYFEGNSIYALIEGSASEKSGLKVGDELLTINGVSYNSPNEYLNVIKENPNAKLDVKVLREGEEVELEVTPSSISRRELNLEYLILKDLKFPHNLNYAWNETKYYLRANLIGIGEIISGQAENVEVQGIVGISKEISSTQSLTEFFYLMSAISLSLGIMNLLPIPGLDGGKILITLIELVRRKPMKKETEVKITLIGFAFLLALTIFVTISDISKL